MRHIKLILFFLLLILTHSLSAQTRLSDSRRSSEETLIYQLHKKDIRQLYLKGYQFDESMLHTYIGKFKRGERMPELPRGNYLKVSANRGKLQYGEIAIDDLDFSVIPGEKIMLCLYDSLGNYITDAIVKKGSKTLSFDKKTNTYNTSKVGHGKLLEVEHKGVFHYIEFEKERYYSRNSSFNIGDKFRHWQSKAKWKAHRGRNRRYFSRGSEKGYEGFIVFSKPKYKPGETVKLKAYLTDTKGKPYKKEVDLKLTAYSTYGRIDTLLTKLTPYRSGMYEYQFTLSDSLGLKLDGYYWINFLSQQKNRTLLRDKFYYEEYELKKINLAVTSEKEKYMPGDSIRIKVKATDENELAIYDGRINITLLSVDDTQSIHASNQVVGVPYTLWQHSVSMNNASEKEILLPDSVFPKNASFKIAVICEFLTADNEQIQEVKQLEWDCNKRRIDFSIDKSVMTIRELLNGSSHTTRAFVELSTDNSEIVWADSVHLPHKMIIPWNITNVNVQTSYVSNSYSMNDYQENPIDAYFYHQGDSIKLTVDNISHIPFWYTIRKKNKVIAKGFATELDYAVKDKGKEGYVMHLSYIYGGKPKEITRELPFIDKNLNMDVETSTLVYPGQKTSVNVTVADKKGKPVKNADVTAYAFSTKFGDYTPPVKVYGKTKSAKRFNILRYNTDFEGIYNREIPLEWEKWKQRMNLDTVEYYRFIYPEVFYSYAEPAINNVTQIAPYVVIDGVLQGVHVLWIDDQPYYLKQADQYQVYSFPVSSGPHKLRFRLFDREITVSEVWAQSGKKTIFSFDGSKSGAAYNDAPGEPDLSVVKVIPDKKNERGQLKDSERQILQNYMITLNNNFKKLNYNSSFEQQLPAYIFYKKMYYYVNGSSLPKVYNNRSHQYVHDPLLIGPFPYPSAMRNAGMGMLYSDKTFVSEFEIEGGYDYTISPTFLKQKSWNRNFINRKLTPFTPNPEFKQNVFTEQDIFNHWNNEVIKNMRSEKTIVYTGKHLKDDILPCNLELSFRKSSDEEELETPILILFSRPEKEDIDYLYYGGERHFMYLPTGSLNMTLFFADETVYTHSLNLRGDSRNYLRLESVPKEKSDTLFNYVFDRHVKRDFRSFELSIFSENSTPNSIDKNIQAEKYTEIMDRVSSGDLVTGFVYDSEGEPLIGVSVVVQNTTIGTITDLEGHFRIAIPDKESKLVFSYIGCKPLVKKVKQGESQTIKLQDDSQILEEVVVVGYGTAKRSSLVGSVIDGKGALQGKIAGVMTGGQASKQRIPQTVDVNSVSPLIIVDGVPYEGDLTDFLKMNEGNILSMKTDTSESTKIYGARAAAGVIYIETNKGNGESEQEDMEELLANSLRRNFHDDAFWQPKLSTDKKGKVSFDVTYPDDITSWNANFIAISGRRQTDVKQLTINSFKALTAQLSVPRFAVRGDKFNAIGKLVNHFPDTLNVRSAIMVNDRTEEKEILLANSHVEKVPLHITEGDSITVAYSLLRENGYFDGEKRSIPIVETGILETYGDFRVINDTLTHRFSPDHQLGRVTVHAEASALEVFLREIEKVDVYPYFCNEQMASKVKALLAKKRVVEMMGIEFKDEKKLKKLIDKLLRNRNEESMWGWWNKDTTQLWITRQVLEALIEAKEEGYTLEFDSQYYINKLGLELNNNLYSHRLELMEDNPAAKRILLSQLMLLKDLGTYMDLKGYFEKIDGLKNRTLDDKLQTMYAMTSIGLKEQVNVDTLMYYSDKTLAGGLYWREKETIGIHPVSRMLPYENNTELTLCAYRILRSLGGHEKEMEQIRNYFFEIRKDGSWRNTYESMRILETIMPDMVTVGEQVSKVNMKLNGEVITAFPYTAEITELDAITVSKEGIFPLYFTMYQQAWNSNPERKSEGFSVRSSFQNGDTVDVLTAGKVANLEVVVTVEGYAEYVQIEIPIPAGCSYDSKEKGSFHHETHREYFKEKVTIFCARLHPGEHKFNVRLLPRYTGVYHLNPAKAELMYFPVFYGHEETKMVKIEDHN